MKKSTITIGVVIIIILMVWLALLPSIIYNYLYVPKEIITNHLTIQEDGTYCYFKYKHNRNEIIEYVVQPDTKTFNITEIKRICTNYTMNYYLECNTDALKEYNNFIDLASRKLRILVLLSCSLFIDIQLLFNARR